MANRKIRVDFPSELSPVDEGEAGLDQMNTGACQLLYDDGDDIHDILRAIDIILAAIAAEGPNEFTKGPWNVI